MSVIIFPLNPALLLGGYLGVDMFFVISGFLITRILLRKLPDKHYNLWTFYKRRFIRLFPALFVTIICTTVVGYFALASEEFLSLSREPLQATFSLSNFLFWAQ